MHVILRGVGANFLIHTHHTLDHGPNFGQEGHKFGSKGRPRQTPPQPRSPGFFERFLFQFFSRFLVTIGMMQGKGKFRSFLRVYQGPPNSQNGHQESQGGQNGQIQQGTIGGVMARSFIARLVPSGNGGSQQEKGKNAIHNQNGTKEPEFPILAWLLLVVVGSCHACLRRHFIFVRRFLSTTIHNDSQIVSSCGSNNRLECQGLV
mmetsp:Transcript_3427/g.7106  ORF Transcript_3427/g.7106 Transcript_3427/m.7106 type:complete len:205 (+) Transcript_3427:1938-2552(+)